MLHRHAVRQPPVDGGGDALELAAGRDIIAKLRPLSKIQASIRRLEARLDARIDAGLYRQRGIGLSVDRGPSPPPQAAPSSSGRQQRAGDAPAPPPASLAPSLPVVLPPPLPVYSPSLPLQLTASQRVRVEDAIAISSTDARGGAAATTGACQTALPSEPPACVAPRGLTPPAGLIPISVAPPSEPVLDAVSNSRSLPALRSSVSSVAKEQQLFELSESRSEIDRAAVGSASDIDAAAATKVDTSSGAVSASGVVTQAGTPRKTASGEDDDGVKDAAAEGGHIAPGNVRREGNTNVRRLLGTFQSRWL